jgi:glycosyltransferase involved in cell wall biosynthesis
MKGKRLLMIINFFPPAAGGGVYRPLSFVKYLSRLSWDITVLTPAPGGFWISDSSLEAQVPPPVRIVRTGSLSGIRVLNVLRKPRSRRSSGGFGALRRLGEMILVPDTYVGWVPFATRAAERLCREEPFDIVYSTSPPDSSHLAARGVSRKFGIRWVADFRDPWIALHLRKPPSFFHRMWHNHLEGSVMEADRIIVTTSWHRDTILKSYPNAIVEKVPNGYDEEDFHSIDALEPPLRPFTLLHSGMLTLGRSTGPFLDGLELFCKRRPDARNDVRVTFLGGRESKNEERVSRAGLAHVVTFDDNVTHEACIKRERQSHVLLLLKHDDERYRGLVPGKLYEYIGARRPLLGVVPEGEAADLIRDNRRGEVARIDDPEDIAEAVSRMYDRYREGSLDGAYSLGELPQYTRRRAASRLDEIMLALLEG